MEQTIKDYWNWLKYNDTENITTHSKNSNNNLDVTTSSYNNWDINQNEGILSNELVKKIIKNNNSNASQELYELLESYEQFYEIRYDGKRKLNWYPHFGEIIFEYLNKEIKMLPIQFLVMEYVFNNNNCNKNDILNADFLVNYNDTFKKSIISTLISGGILELNKDTLCITTNPDNIILDYINIFFTTTNYINIWEQKRQDHLIMERQDVISSQINHFVKKEPISKTDLYKKVTSNIKIFELDDILFNKTIDNMIEKDYIKYENDMLVKIFYA